MRGRRRRGRQHQHIEGPADRDARLLESNPPLACQAVNAQVVDSHIGHIIRRLHRVRENLASRAVVYAHRALMAEARPRGQHACRTDRQRVLVRRGSMGVTEPLEAASGTIKVVMVQVVGREGARWDRPASGSKVGDGVHLRAAEAAGRDGAPLGEHGPTLADESGATRRICAVLGRWLCG